MKITKTNCKLVVSHNTAVKKMKKINYENFILELLKNKTKNK